jgi:light-regulated signal transduction histidine kinase (bacteriophytochrome)
MIGCTDRSDFWEFYVKDNGKGIEKKYFEKIFVAFENWKMITNLQVLDCQLLKK